MLAAPCNLGHVIQLEGDSGQQNGIARALAGLFVDATTSVVAVVHSIERCQMRLARFLQLSNYMEALPLKTLPLLFGPIVPPGKVYNQDCILCQ